MENMTINTNKENRGRRTLRKIMTWVLTLAMLLGIMLTFTLTAFAAGDGTIGNPWEVTASTATLITGYWIVPAGQTINRTGTITVSGNVTLTLAAGAETAVL